MKHFILQILGLFVFTSCTSLPPKSARTFSLSDFLRDQESRELALSSVEGKLQIRYQIKGQVLAGNARLAKEHDKSRLEVSDPVGTVRYWFTVDRDQATAFYEDNKTAYLSFDGGTSYLKKMFSLELNAQELNGLWMGILPKRWRTKTDSTFQMDGDQLRGVIRSNDQEIEFWVSPENGLLTQLSWASSEKRIKLMINDHDACCSSEKGQIILGHHVVLSLPEQADQIVLDWIELNRVVEKQNPRRFEGILPKGTKTIQLRK